MLELLVAKERIKQALELGLRSIILEGHSMLDFENIESSLWDLSYNGTLVHDICFMGLRFDRFKAQYMLRMEIELLIP